MRFAWSTSSVNIMSLSFATPVMNLNFFLVQDFGPYCMSPLPKDQFSLSTSRRLMKMS